MNRNQIFTHFVPTSGIKTTETLVNWKTGEKHTYAVYRDADAPQPATIPARMWEPDPVKLAEAHASIEYIKQVAEESRRIGAASAANMRS